MIWIVLVLASFGCALSLVCLFGDAFRDRLRAELHRSRTGLRSAERSRPFGV